MLEEATSLFVDKEYDERFETVADNRIFKSNLFFHFSLIYLSLFPHRKLLYSEEKKNKFPLDFR